MTQTLARIRITGVSHRVARSCAWLAPRARRRGKPCARAASENAPELEQPSQPLFPSGKALKTSSKYPHELLKSEVFLLRCDRLRNLCPARPVCSAAGSNRHPPRLVASLPLSPSGSICAARWTDSGRDFNEDSSNGKSRRCCEQLDSSAFVFRIGSLSGALLHAKVIREQPNRALSLR